MWGRSALAPERERGQRRRRDAGRDPRDEHEGVSRLTEKEPEMDLKQLLGDETGYLLEHRATGVSRDKLHLPGADFVDRTAIATR